MKFKYISGLMLAAAVAVAPACNDDEDYSPASGKVVTSITAGDISVSSVQAIVPVSATGIDKMASSSYAIGVIYSTSEDPTTDGKFVAGSADENGNIIAVISNLVPGKTYYYAPCVRLQGKVNECGEVRSFTANNSTFETIGSSDITSTKATLTASFADIEGSNTKHGIKVSLSKDNLKTAKSYEAGTVKGLLPGNKYYYAAYEEINGETILGAIKEFTTEAQEMEFVNLGLSVRWAKFNIGAEAESEIGTYFAYGDITGEGVEETPTKSISGTEFDAAQNCNLGTLPNKKQISELIAKTTQTLDEVDGVKGIRFTGNNGNSIFLPMGGLIDGHNNSNLNSGFYWSGEISTKDSQYANMLKMTDKVEASVLSTAIKMNIRSILAPKTISLTDQTLAQGDLENNGNYRVPICNAWGDDLINPESLAFKKSLAVTFRISGIDETIAGKSCIAALGILPADVTGGLDWGRNRWEQDAMDPYCTEITGDGIYTVWLDETWATKSTESLAIAIKGLSETCAKGKTQNDKGDEVWDVSNINIEIITIEIDSELTDKSFEQGDLENNGNYRVMFCNAWGPDAIEPESLAFDKHISVSFCITGINDKIAGKSCIASLGILPAGTDGGDDWGRSRWEQTEMDKYCTAITGDGVYTVWLDENWATSSTNQFLIGISKLSETCAKGKKTNDQGNEVWDVSNINIKVLNITNY